MARPRILIPGTARRGFKCHAFIGRHGPKLRVPTSREWDSRAISLDGTGGKSSAPASAGALLFSGLHHLVTAKERQEHKTGLVPCCMLNANGVLHFSLGFLNPRTWYGPGDEL
jgi:hypothetical protein